MASYEVTLWNKISLMGNKAVIVRYEVTLDDTCCSYILAIMRIKVAITWNKVAIASFKVTF